MTPRSTTGFTVMVVDDDPSVLATYRRLLQRAGYRTLSAACPTELLANGAAADPTIDVLLLDYKMPGMDGLELLAELRRRECRARCILISAFLNDDLRRQARHLGVDHVLEKPVDMTCLRRIIRELLPACAPSGVQLVAGERSDDE